MQPNELKIEAWPEPATTGMHVGMSKGVKVTHIQTGLVETCDTERSQHMNREKALQKLAMRLAISET